MLKTFYHGGIVAPFDTVSKRLLHYFAETHVFDRFPTENYAGTGLSMLHLNGWLCSIPELRITRVKLAAIVINQPDLEAIPNALPGLQ